MLTKTIELDPIRNEWLSYTQVTAAMNLLNKEAGTHYPIGPVLCIGNGSTSKQQDFACKEAVEAAQKPPYVAIVPVNRDNMHWTCMVLKYDPSTKTTKATYADSLGCGPNVELIQCLSRHSITSLENVSQPQQNDSVNCGLWAARNGHEMANDKPLPLTINAEAMRQELSKIHNAAESNSELDGVIELYCSGLEERYNYDNSSYFIDNTGKSYTKEGGKCLFYQTHIDENGHKIFECCVKDKPDSESYTLRTYNQNTGDFDEKFIPSQEVQHEVQQMTQTMESAKQKCLRNLDKIAQDNPEYVIQYGNYAFYGNISTGDPYIPQGNGNSVCVEVVNGNIIHSSRNDTTGITTTQKLEGDRWVGCNSYDPPKYYAKLKDELKTRSELEKQISALPYNYKEIFTRNINICNNLTNGIVCDPLQVINAMKSIATNYDKFKLTSYAKHARDLIEILTKKQDYRQETALSALYEIQNESNIALKLEQSLNDTKRRIEAMIKDRSIPRRKLRIVKNVVHGNI